MSTASGLIAFGPVPSEVLHDRDAVDAVLDGEVLVGCPELVGVDQRLDLAFAESAGTSIALVRGGGGRGRDTDSQGGNLLVDLVGGVRELS